MIWNRKLILFITTILVISGAASISFVSFSNLKKSCSRDDEDVVQVTRRLHSLYKANGRFPDQTLFGTKDVPNTALMDQFRTLAEMQKKYRIDLYSNGTVEEAYVYLKRNCKIRITPADYEVYPK